MIFGLVVFPHENLALSSLALHCCLCCCYNPSTATANLPSYRVPLLSALTVCESLELCVVLELSPYKGKFNATSIACEQVQRQLCGGFCVVSQKERTDVEKCRTLDGNVAIQT